MNQTGIVFAALTSVTSCVLMWISASESMNAAAAYTNAAGADGEAKSMFLRDAKSKGISGSIWNAYNQSFVCAYYAVYTTASILISAYVLRSLRSMLQNVESQKFILDKLDKKSADSQMSLQSFGGTLSSLQSFGELEHERIVAINSVASQTSQRLRLVMNKIRINCFVSILTAFMGIFYNGIISAASLLPAKSSCSDSFSNCDECKLIFVFFVCNL
jgi:hypothetical protein